MCEENSNSTKTITYVPSNVKSLQTNNKTSWRMAEAKKAASAAMGLAMEGDTSIRF